MRHFFLLNVLAAGLMSASVVAQELSPDELVMLPEQHRRDVAPMIVLLKQQVPSCQQLLSPYNVGLSSKQTNPANPSFFAQCGEGAGVEVIHFTWMDAVNKTVPAQPEPPLTITSSQAGRDCERAAKADALIPASVDFSRILHSGFRANTDGTAVYRSQFSAKNGFGVEMRYAITCHFDGLTLKDKTVRPAD